MNNDSIDNEKLDNPDDSNQNIEERFNVGDWIDLRAAEDVTMKAGEFQLGLMEIFRDF